MMTLSLRIVPLKIAAKPFLPEIFSRGPTHIEEGNIHQVFGVCDSHADFVAA
jgi:hypothetical protein